MSLTHNFESSETLVRRLGASGIHSEHIVSDLKIGYPTDALSGISDPMRVQEANG